jgi:nucleoside-diphosphate-sugar epimerase
MTKKKVLITGGSGFIGASTTKHLLDLGHYVTILDIDRPKIAHSNLLFIQADIRDKESCREAFKTNDYVLHAAAMSRSGPSNPLWRECISTNIDGTANMLELALEYGIKKFVYCGSSTYYGHQNGPQHESLPPDLLNFYGATKFAGEEIVRQFEKSFHLSTLVLRYFNVYGPGQPSVGPYALVMGIFSKAARENTQVIIDGDGEQIRDFVHVDDVASANIMALFSSHHNDTINIGSGIGVTIRELANRFELRYTFGPNREGDARLTLADTERARMLLNWEASITLEEGVKWMRLQNGNC